MRSLNLLIAKEWRELLASRAWWLLLLIIGPLVGNSFISAVNLYAEASGIGGAPAALPQGLTPLDGILVPTFGAYDLAVTLLFPFVAIRLISAEKETGALRLALQFPVNSGIMIFAKLTALLSGWLIAWVPGLMALAMWKYYGGHLHAPETLNLLLGHWLRMILSGSVAIFAAVLAESSAGAAIVTLGFTLGTWALEFIASGRGGWPAIIAAFTPTAALRVFEQGLLRSSIIIVILALSTAGYSIAAICLHSGRSLKTRLLRTIAVSIAIAVVVWIGSGASSSRDMSENRRNSFSGADEETLHRITGKMIITINLAPEDPRLMDYERSLLNKLRRILPRLEVNYAAQSRTGLFEGSDEHYGEIWYELGGRKVMNRSTTEPIVIEQLYQLADIPPPQKTDEPVYPGFPLAAQPAGAKAIFYALWPLAVIFIWWLTRHRRR